MNDASVVLSSGWVWAHCFSRGCTSPATLRDKGGSAGAAPATLPGACSHSCCAFCMKDVRAALDASASGSQLLVVAAGAAAALLAPLAGASPTLLPPSAAPPLAAALPAALAAILSWLAFLKFRSVWEWNAGELSDSSLGNLATNAAMAFAVHR
jgi:hypothetical protein